MTRKQITTTIEEKLLQGIKIQAIKEGKNVNELLEKLIDEYLTKKSSRD